MGFHPQQTITRDGTVCYSGWGMRKWPKMYWQMQNGSLAEDGVYALYYHLFPFNDWNG